MTGPAWTFASAFVVVLVLFTIAFAELLRLYPERDRLAADLRMVRGQRDLTEAERNDLDAVLRMLLAERPPATVLPFGPVQSGVVRRVPRQRNGEGA